MYKCEKHRLNKTMIDLYNENKHISNHLEISCMSYMKIDKIEKLDVCVRGNMREIKFR